MGDGGCAGGGVPESELGEVNGVSVGHDGPEGAIVELCITHQKLYNFPKSSIINLDLNIDYRLVGDIIMN